MTNVNGLSSTQQDKASLARRVKAQIFTLQYASRHGFLHIAFSSSSLRKIHVKRSR
jgi:hypothetical protein